MDEQEMWHAMYTGINFACGSLTDLELVAINNIAQWGADPRGVIGYEKVKHLFDQANGTKMHEETQRALAAVVNQRLGSKVATK